MDPTRRAAGFSSTDRWIELGRQNPAQSAPARAKTEATAATNTKADAVEIAATPQARDRWVLQWAGQALDLVGQVRDGLQANRKSAHQCQADERLLQSAKAAAQDLAEKAKPLMAPRMPGYQRPGVGDTQRVRDLLLAENGVLGTFDRLATGALNSNEADQQLADLEVRIQAVVEPLRAQSLGQRLDLTA